MFPKNLEELKEHCQAPSGFHGIIIWKCPKCFVKNLELYKFCNNNDFRGDCEKLFKATILHNRKKKLEKLLA